MSDFKLRPFTAFEPAGLPPREGDDWGGWRLEGPELVFPAPSGGVYPIGLERSTRSARMFDTIMQVAGKVWATDACLAGLVRALNDIFHPQSTLCSCGTDKRLTEKQIKTRRGRA